MGPPEVMREQLDHLADASTWPNVTLQVLPFTAGPHPSLNGPFTIIEFPERYDPDVVYSESVAGNAYLERDREVRACSETFDLLRAVAMSPADSTDLIIKHANQVSLSTQPRREE